MSSDTDERLKELFELSRLYDLYGALLSEHTARIFEDYVLNDYSLSEIAAEVGMSRQGVRDTVVRCGAKLKDYEEKLGLLEKMTKVSTLLTEAGELIKNGSEETRKASGLIESAIVILEQDKSEKTV